MIYGESKARRYVCLSVIGVDCFGECGASLLRFVCLRY